MRMHAKGLAGGAAMLLIAACIGGCYGDPMQPQTAHQRTFRTPEEATSALIDAALHSDYDEIIPIFGPDSERVIAGNRERAAGDLQRLSVEYDLEHAFVKGEDGSLVLTVGPEAWEFPAALVQQEGRWLFDSDAAISAALEFWISKNESEAVANVAECVAAQRAYYDLNPDQAPSPAYAPRFASSYGTHDGLCWPENMSPPWSPLSDFPEFSRAMQYVTHEGAHPRAFHGYYYRILTKQGPGAPGGAKDWVDSSGRLTGGFAFLAWPEVYGTTGMLSFQGSSEDGVYAKDLGENTEDLAKHIDAFDAADGWSLTDATPPAEDQPADEATAPMAD